MKDLEKAKQRLAQGNFTCVLCYDETVYTSSQKGIAPMLAFLEEGISLVGFSAADKIIGKAAAMLFALAGVKAVYGEVMSQAAVDYLKQKGILFFYGVLTKQIINRRGDGLCPMEESVLFIQDEQEAFWSLRHKRAELQGETKMKKLGFGCMRLPLLESENPKSIDLKHTEEMVDFFLANGFSYFDTAYMYHDGESERVVKKVLVDRYPRESFLLATKLPTPHLNEKSDMERIFNEQLEKTGAGYFDYYLMHCLNRDLYQKLEELDGFGFGLQKKKEGKIRRLGFSFHDTAEVLDVILTDHPEVEFVQLQINYLDWEHEKIQSRLCYEVARKHKKDIIVMEPVKGGALAQLPSAAERVLQQTGTPLSIPSFAIRFAAGLEGVIMVLSGMSNQKQLQDNVGYMKDFIPLSKVEQEACFAAAEIILKKKDIPCTACHYCEEVCPKHIPIPDYFSLYNAALSGDSQKGTNAKVDYLSLSAKGSSIEDCIGCRRCEEQCPQHIRVADCLQQMKETFE